MYATQGSKDVVPETIPEFYNPIIQAAYRALAAGAEVQSLWGYAHGALVAAYPGKQQFERAWQTFQKYDARNFDLYVSRFNEHFRPFVKE